MKELQGKFFNNECTKEEAEGFIKWYFSEHGEKEIERQIEKYWAAKTSSNWNSSEVFKQIQSIKDNSDLFVSHNAESNGSSTVNASGLEKNFQWSNYWKVAASVLLVVGLSYAVFNISNNAFVQPHNLVEYIEKSNPSGQKSTIHLKDGSRIILNSDSKVKYPATFSNSERVIELEGEAYFEVAKDSIRPFKVKTANTMTTALGTTFNIDGFDDEKEIKISLTSGRVEVKKIGGGTGEIFLLDPGEGVVYSKSDERMFKTDIDISKVMAWTSKELIFSDDDFEEVIRRLERWYGVEILVEDEVNGVLSASFTNENLKAVLEGISYSFSLDYEISDKKVILKAKK